MSYAAKIIADSVSPSGARLTTMEITYQRFIHAEFMTHRMFSRNTASSRAIPTARFIEQVENDPAMPVWWGKNQSGMQAAVELEGDDLQRAKDTWLNASIDAIGWVKSLSTLGLHKQITNRILEPWLWHTAVVTGTEYSNFFALRCHPEAQPEIRHIAEMMRELYQTNVPTTRVGRWNWHLPYITDEDILHAEHLYAPWTEAEDEFLRKVSVARCAAVSYVRQGEKREYDKDLQLHDRLAASGHWSPFEHVARPISDDDIKALPKGLTEDTSGNYWCGNFRGWWQYRKDFVGENR